MNSLPFDVNLPLLSSWCGIVELALLDTALCNRTQRKQFLKIISCDFFILNTNKVLNGEHAMTLEEIGEKFNLTRERVRQIKEKAIRRLRHTSRSKTLKPYLG